MRVSKVFQWGNLLLSALLMLAIWVLLVWVGSRPALKGLIDLSPQQRGTIDPVTVELLEDLGEGDVRVRIHTYFGYSNVEGSDAVQRQRQSILHRLRELTSTLLRQYEFHGRDVVRVLHHDRYRGSEESRRVAQRVNGVGQDVIVVEVERPGFESRFRKLSLELDLGVIEVPELRQQGPAPQAQVPVLKDFKGEAVLSGALKGLLLQGVPTVYFFSGASHGLDLYGTSGSGYSRLRDMLSQQGFRTADLDFTRSPVVPEDASMVVVIEPRREFATTEVLALHNYLKKGGRLLLNYFWAPTDGWNPTGGELGKLLGFELGDGRIMHMIRAGRDGAGVAGDPRVTKLDLRVNPNNPITKRIFVSNQLLQLADAREIRKRSDAPDGVRFDPLLGTGPQAWTEQTRPGQPYDYQPPRIANPFQQYTVGAVMTVDNDAGGEAGQAVIVGGLFANNVGLPINGLLASNIANWLTERRILLDIQGQAYKARHIEIVLQQFNNIWMLLVAFVPGAFLLTGALVFWRRKRHGLGKAVPAMVTGIVRPRQGAEGATGDAPEGASAADSSGAAPTDKQHDGAL